MSEGMARCTSKWHYRYLGSTKEGIPRSLIPNNEVLGKKEGN